VPVTGAIAPLEADSAGAAGSVTGVSAPWMLDTAGAPVPVTGTSVPPTADPAGDAMLVSGVSVPGVLGSVGRAVLVTGASAPRTVAAGASPPGVDATGAGVSAAGEPPGPAGVVEDATAPWPVVLAGPAVFVTVASVPRAVDSPEVAVVVAGPSVAVAEAVGGVVCVAGAGAPGRFGSTGAVVGTAVLPVTGAVALVTGASACPAVGEAVCCPVAPPAVGGCVLPVPAAPVTVVFWPVPDAFVPDCPEDPVDGTSAVAV
jgi:hypothetical protein